MPATLNFFFKQCQEHGLKGAAENVQAAALAGLQLQSMLLTLLEKEIKSCEQVIFSLRMK
jgi:hypothetical protein